MLKRTMLLCLTLCIAAGCAACASTQKGDVMQTGLYVGANTVQTAEMAYTAVRVAWHEGTVSDDDMREAEELYAGYINAFAVYEAALRVYDASDEPNNLIPARDAVVKAANALFDLAVQLGVM
jgi:hypothetical protein